MITNADGCLATRHSHLATCDRTVSQFESAGRFDGEDVLGVSIVGGLHNTNSCMKLLTDCCVASRIGIVNW